MRAAPHRIFLMVIGVPSPMEENITGEGRNGKACGYSARLGFEIGAHALRATAPPMLDHEADIAKVQEWLGHGTSAQRASTITAARVWRTARQGFVHFEPVNKGVPPLPPERPQQDSDDPGDNA